MKNKIYKLIAAVLVAALLVTMLPADTWNKIDRGDAPTEVCAAGSTVYDNLWCHMVDRYGRHQYFYMMTPKAEGKYPVVVFYPGLGGPTVWNRLYKSVNNWVASGLIEPVVVIMPVFGLTYNGSKTSEDYITYIKNAKYEGGEYQVHVTQNVLEDILDKTKSGDFDNRLETDSSQSVKNVNKKLDYSKDVTLTGFSMGGAFALYAGAKLKKRFVNVGAFSPARSFYLGEGEWGWLRYGSEAVYSNSPNSHFMMAYSTEEGEFGKTVNDFNKVVDANEENTNHFEIYETVGTHGNTLTMREMFVYLYYLQNDVLLNDKDSMATLTQACSGANHPYDKGVVTKKATCTTDGTKTYTCSFCKATKKEVIKATGHSYDAGVVTKKATCTKAGVRTFTCKTCKATKTETIKATGHKWDAGKVTKKPTYTTAGVKTFTCKTCGATKTQSIPQTGVNLGKGTTVYDGIDYSKVYDYNYYLNKYPDLMKAFKGNPNGAIRHFVVYGMKEGRQAKDTFNMTVYKNRYADLRKAYGNDNKAYYMHYIKYGYKEKRKAY